MLMPAAKPRFALHAAAAEIGQLQRVGSVALVRANVEVRPRRPACSPRRSGRYDRQCTSALCVVGRIVRPGPPRRPRSPRLHDRKHLARHQLRHAPRISTAVTRSAVDKPASQAFVVDCMHVAGIVVQIAQLVDIPSMIVTLAQSRRDGRVRPDDPAADNQHLSRFHAGHAAQRIPGPSSAAQGTSPLNAHLPRHFAHRRQQRQPVVASVIVS